MKKIVSTLLTLLLVVSFAGVRIHNINSRVEHINNQQNKIDYVAEITGEKTDYFYRIKSSQFNSAYGELFKKGWKYFYIPTETAGNGQSDVMFEADNILQMDYYGGFMNAGRVELFQSHTDTMITPQFDLAYCQKGEEYLVREMANGDVAEFIEMYGKRFSVQYLDFYSTEKTYGKKEPLKTVYCLWWKEDGISFFAASEYPLEELKTFFESFTKIEVKEY